MESKVENETVVDGEEKPAVVEEKSVVVDGEKKPAVVEEKSTAVDGEKKPAVIEEKSTAAEKVNTAELETRIVRQLEFYFSDTNLPYDKFLRNETKTDDGWVKISVLLTFKRLASITKEPSVIVTAVKNATDSILEMDEANEKIRRRTDKAVPVADQEFLNEMIERSVYCKGFPKTATMDQLLEYAATFGDKITKVTPRKFKNKEFKGTLYLTFCTKEDAENFLNLESVQYNNVEIQRMWEKDFLEEKKKEYEDKRARKDEKIKAETEKFFKKGYLLKADNLSETVTVDSIKTLCSGYEWQVSFVKIDDDQKAAWIRLKPVKTAKDLLEAIAGKVNDLNINFSVPDDEAEQNMLNEMTKEMKVILSMKDKLKREKNKNKGGKRYNNKRRNEDGYHSNKRLKTNGE